jgi:hypothetical protein
MKVRCYNEKYEHYDCYGGRGIKIRDEWREDFVSFKDWALENGYRDDLEIERIDVDGDYTPSNCTWETRERQVLNRRNTLYLINPHTHEIKPLMDWCRLYDFKYKLAWARHNKGKSFDDIFLPLQSHI